MDHTYVDQLMQNNVLESDESDTIYNYTSRRSVNIRNLGGGANAKPNGGFPPIVECDKEEAENFIKLEEPKKREFKPIKSSVSIKKIMDKRREKTPFIKLRNPKKKMIID